MLTPAHTINPPSPYGDLSRTKAGLFRVSCSLQVRTQVDYQIPRLIAIHQKRELISIRHASTHDVPPPSFCDIYGVVELTWYIPWAYGRRGHFHEVHYEQFELTPCVLSLLEGHFAVELHSAIYSDELLTRGIGHPLLLLTVFDLVLTLYELHLFFENDSNVCKSQFETLQWLVPPLVMSVQLPSFLWPSKPLVQVNQVW